MNQRIASLKLRFSLKATLALTAVCALVSATLLPAIVEHRRVASLVGAGIQIYTEPRGQYLLRQIAGNTLSERVVFVHLDDPSIDDAWLKRLEQFPYIENVSIKSTNVTDAGLQSLGRLPNLMTLDLIDTHVTPEGIAKLRDSCRRLRRVASYSSLP